MKVDMLFRCCKLPADGVCTWCCGGEAVPGRVASPSDYDEPWEPDRPPGCDWCGGRGCQICCAPGYAGVERD